ncbi:hypothetical protein M011DRAFT_456884 [Sporormia fimetaria CBS 119925]|uniref:Uncharacterized protein n=1 Tax=Sporormia fimetaria CBS 119925 TaxID=1340428 RepID=A0A6A6VJV3_9PLEO|nr:hypothetical protein M011DRAFT_456884 [Sporormia fimetaria CBS 119925]
MPPPDEPNNNTLHRLLGPNYRSILIVFYITLVILIPGALRTIVDRLFSLPSLLRSLLNLLLPFTNPATPLIQDLLHTAALCSLLYYAPQISEYIRNAENRFVELKTREEARERDSNRVPNPNESAQAEEQPPNAPLEPGPENNDHTILQPQPRAPTPPPGDQEDWPPQPAPPQQQQPPFDANEEAGPAAPRPAAPPTRTVGAKKARSLARRDQRRAYHEFIRQQAEQRRQEEAEGREEREAALAAEKARRAEAERAIEERNREERQSKKEQERRELEEEWERRDRAIAKVRTLLEEAGAVNLEDIAWAEQKDWLWIARLVKASGILNQNQDSDGETHTMITSEGWLVRLDAALMQQVYAEAVELGNAQDGKVGFDEFADILEDAVLARTRT